MSAERPCTCHPSEAPVPCERQYALTACRLARLRKDAAAANVHDVQLESFVAREVMWCFEEIDHLGAEVERLTALHRKVADRYADCLAALVAARNDERERLAVMELQGPEIAAAIRASAKPISEK